MKKNILLGVCGGIAAYKTCELTRVLVKDGFTVKVIMTDSARQFVTPLVFQTLSNNPVYGDMFALIKEESVQHIDLAQWASLCVVAPLSANTLSKIAYGLCDNLLTTIVCALPAHTKVLLAPAMNDGMWKNPIIAENAARLAKLKKYVLMTPVAGMLACGAYGEGRMPEPAAIYKKIKDLLR
jgi:phosphopantothenoylcysteine decarboxylase/phosphopantothenate--cysteine ligase